MKHVDCPPIGGDSKKNRIAVTEKYRPIYEKQAKANQLSGLIQNNKDSVMVNLPKRESVNTSEKLAEIAGVSEKTYRMGAKVLSFRIGEPNNSAGHSPQKCGNPKMDIQVRRS